MKQKILFLMFTDEPCRQNHVLMYAIDLHEKGYEVKIVVEGLATRCIRRVEKDDAKFRQLFEKVNNYRLFAGVCQAASSGCANENAKDGTQKLSDLFANQNIPSLAEMEGHASIAKYVNAGYQIVVF